MHTRLPVIQDNQNADLCTPCGGKCCKVIPGIYWPEDFGSSHDEVIANVRAAIATGKTTLDYWEGKRKLFYPRPAIKGKEGVTIDPSWGGECTHLTAKGCVLTWATRPAQCRSLEPRPRGACHSAAPFDSKYEAAQAWLPYDLTSIAADSAHIYAPVVVRVAKSGRVRGESE
jgi:Fe-S-cluster containining protein